MLDRDHWIHDYYAGDTFRMWCKIVFPIVKEVSSTAVSTVSGTAKAVSGAAKAVVTPSASKPGNGFKLSIAAFFVGGIVYGAVQSNDDHLNPFTTAYHTALPLSLDKNHDAMSKEDKSTDTAAVIVGNICAAPWFVPAAAGAFIGNVSTTTWNHVISPVVHWVSGPDASTAPAQKGATPTKSAPAQKTSDASGYEKSVRPNFQARPLEYKYS